MNIDLKSEKGLIPTSIRGFTLMEILITVAIIGVLSTVVIFSVSAVRSKATDAKKISDLKQIDRAIDTYFVSCHRFPTSGNLSAILNDCDGNAILPSFPGGSAALYPYYPFTTSTGAKRYHVCVVLDNDAPSGKAGNSKFDSSDPCDGANTKVFDLVGGA